MKILVACSLKGTLNLNIDCRKHKVKTLLDLSRYLAANCGYNSYGGVINILTDNGRFIGDRHYVLDRKKVNRIVITPYATRHGGTIVYNKFVFSDYGPNYQKVVEALSVLPEEIRSKVSWEFVN